MSNKSIVENGKNTQFQKGQSGNPKGRPRKRVNEIGEKIGIEFGISISKADKYQILESLLEMNVKEITAISKDKDSPVFMVMIANGILSDIKKGRTNTLSECFDRFFGKAISRNEVTGADGGAIKTESKIDVSKLSDKELDSLIDTFDKIVVE